MSEELNQDSPITTLAAPVYGFISRPPSEVYEALVDPAILSEYFTTGGASGRMQAGETVTWDFKDFPGAFPVRVLDAMPDSLVVFEWAAVAGSAEAEDSFNKVTFTFAPVDDGARTRVEILEEGWRLNQLGANNALGNTMGWTGMLAAMKVWLEHGINLREGFYA